MAEPTIKNLNGGFLVEVDRTGDFKADQQRALQALKDKGIKRSTRAEAMGQQAHAFAIAAMHIYDKDLRKPPRNFSSIAPFIVNSTFSIELCLKTLGFIHNKRLTGHDLLPLYESLPAAAHQQIDVVLPDCIKRYGPTSRVDLRTCIAGLSKAYKQWRYFFELPEADTVHFDQLSFVLNVMDEACRMALFSPATTPQG